MRENKYLEFKSEISNTFLKTVSAFANFNDGEILFGVEDDGTECGIDTPEQACLDIENRINDSISPKPDFEIVIEQGNVIRLIVHKGQYTPYMYKGKAYRRSDTASVEVDQEELKKLVLHGSNLYFEELPYGDPSLKFSTLEAKMQDKMGITRITEDILRTLGLRTANGKYNNAAALLSDKNSFYGVDIARFGKSISEIMNRETVEKESILRQFDKAVKEYKRYYQYEEITGMDRKTVESIPEAAFREAVANALVHRDWNVRSHIRISMYEDRIEIKSPGGLPNGITEEEYLHGEISCLRNPILGNVFFRMHYIEMFGTGIRRILDSYEDSTLKPQFNITDNVISVILPVLTDRFEVTAAEDCIIKVLKKGRPLASSEIAACTGFSKAKTVRLLNELINKGYVKTKGNGRGTKYIL